MITEQPSGADEITLDTRLEYGTDDPVRIAIRRRGRRYDLSDDGAAIAHAGRPPGWLAAMNRVVEADGFNVNRRGVVFVPVVEGRDITSLALRLGATSRACYLAVLELGE